MKYKTFIDMSDMRLNGDILDAGFQNYGIIYNIYKYEKNNYDVEYFCSDQAEDNIKKNSYDSCCLFFTMSKFKSCRGRKKILDYAYESLRCDGIIYIWDIDKDIMKTYNSRIKVRLPDFKIKNFIVRDVNVFKDCSMKKSLELLGDHFNVIESKSWDGVYYIKAKKIIKSL